jgi:SAM-dependent MidA family methyltransferase
MVFSSSTDEHAVKRHHALTALIQQEADRHPPLSFARFMELALYAPRLGFYEQSGNSIGRRGDFFTSVSVGPLFGELLACQFSAWLEKLGKGHPVILEAGGHDGRLARDILTSLERLSPSLYEHVQYWMLEPSETRSRNQQSKLQELGGKVRWFQSWTDLSSFCEKERRGFTGIVFANELLDALPVHRLRWNRSAGEWRELGVAMGDQDFQWVEMPLGEKTLAYTKSISVLGKDDGEAAFWPFLPEALLEVLPDGFTIEICPGAVAWWKQAASLIDRGWLATFDYGLSALEFFQPHRKNGTVRAYRKHQLTDEVLSNAGIQDITSSVNFTLLKLVGESAGLQTESMKSQADFLANVLRVFEPAAGRPARDNWARQFQTLTHPDHLGRAFKALIQSRGCFVAQQTRTAGSPAR